MARKRKKELPEPPLPHDTPEVRFLERPDGVYWSYSGRSEEFGPYKTFAEAAADAESRADSDFEPGESLEEAEREIGISEWIDPDTGVPAEESVPRIEDH